LFGHVLVLSVDSMFSFSARQTLDPFVVACFLHDRAIPDSPTAVSCGDEGVVQYLAARTIHLAARAHLNPSSTTQYPTTRYQH